MAYGEADVYIHLFLTTLAGGEWSASSPGRITPAETAPGTFCIGGWVVPRAGLDNLEKWKFLSLLGLELWPLGCLAHIQSLYRLRYPGFTKYSSMNKHKLTEVAREYQKDRWKFALQKINLLPARR
jgi:hypothetical protein